MAEPFLRWVGGKRRFIPMLAPRISWYLEQTEGRFIEPFAGGAAMSLHLARPLTILNDVIPDLVSCYRALRDNLEQVGVLLFELREWGSEEEHYYTVRATTPDNEIEAAARFIYLNAHCFNGLWRMNEKGQMNVPYGKKAGRLTDEFFDKLEAASQALELFSLMEGDFSAPVRQAERGDLIYLDPPYDKTFTRYSGKAFSGTSIDRLGAELKEAHDRGVAFILHNSDTEKVRYWFGDYAKVLKVKEKRSVAASGDSRDEAHCVLISNVPELLSLAS